MELDSQLQIDHALRVGDALAADALHRAPFARSVTTVLQRVSNDASLVVSVEGSWGSGKSSVLAMVEELLTALPHQERPVVVHSTLGLSATGRRCSGSSWPALARKSSSRTMRRMGNGWPRS